ncbi:MAG: hypothetical protein AMJ77_03525 [Dehalococcoidia bacterium SM23_28_2]|nr:MAG: hypothetical protein AMJ77_03525 [Dehalococcoidia bacterium SM23_28_2]
MPGSGDCDDGTDNDGGALIDAADPNCQAFIDEDPGGDANGDGCPGVCGVDDDGDTVIDEGSVYDDDEDGSNDEDAIDGIDTDDDGMEDGSGPASPGYGDCDDGVDNNDDDTDLGPDPGYMNDPQCDAFDGEDPADFDDDADTVADEDPAGNNDPTLADEYCAIIRSSYPGETNITFVYTGGSVVIHKQWDKLMDTVILKKDDIQKVSVPGIGSVELPKDANGNGERDAEDAHLMDHNGETQNHAVMWDEGRKTDRSAEGPIRLIDVVHGQHAECDADDPRCECPEGDPWCWEGDHPTTGAVMLAFIESPKGCTYFTNPSTIDLDDDGVPDLQPGEADFGTAMAGISDWRGFFIGPQSLPADAQLTAEAQAELAAHLLESPMSNNGDPDTVFYEADYAGVYVDTTCEEQARIIFKVGYPDLVQSDPPFPEPEEVTINWTTVQPAKQPQIRWAGEKIVLEKRWAVPGEWYPEPGGIDDDGDGLINEDSGDASTDDEDGDGWIDEDGLTGEDGMTTGVDDDGDQHEDGTRGVPGDGECTDGIDNDSDTKIDGADTNCLAGAGVDEDVMDDDADGLIDEDPLDLCPYAGYYVKYIKLDGPGALVSGLPDIMAPTASEPEVVWTTVQSDCTSAAMYVSEEQGQVDVDAELISPYCLSCGPINEHAFLVWYLKIYELKLTNVPGARTLHNDGQFNEAEGADLLDPTVGDVTEETVNVSQDALLRVRVKGYFFGGNDSWRPDMCIDVNGDGDGDDATTDDVPGEPYQTISHEGCAYPDHILAAGHWVLPDDIADLAGPHPDRIPDYDVMSEPSVSATALIGPKSTLDSHDDVVRQVVPCVQPKTVKVGGVDVVIPNWDCTRKTIDPDGQITEADALMPPLKILVALDDEDAGFLKAADKDTDVGITSAYQSSMIPANMNIPQPANNCRYDWDSWGFSTNPQYDYEFYDVLTKTEDPETGLIRDFHFYTDNRGEGFFFANGDSNLTYDDCRTDPVTGAPDCSQGDVVGMSEITVIGDYPYCRKHTAVESNVVTKTWEWGGEKTVSAEKLDANHTRIIAHVKDRDGYCKWDKGLKLTVDPMEVQFSPSLNPVEGEEITFEIVNGIGHILGADLDGISPNALFSEDPTPLGTANVTGWEDGVLINSEKAVGMAEHVDLLDAIDMAAQERLSDDVAAECQAWVLIEHPAGAELEVSVSFDDPEGRIIRHYPPTELTVFLQTGWNDSCYAGPEGDIEDIMDDAGLLEDLIAVYRLDPLDTADPWDGYFPSSPEASDLETLMPYDQLFILTAASGSWSQEITVGALANGKDEQVDLVVGWNSVCYAGGLKTTEEAVSPIAGDFSIMYNLSSSGWLRYIPGRPEVPDTLTSLDRFMSVFLLVTAADGTTWAFGP